MHQFQLIWQNLKCSADNLLWFSDSVPKVGGGDKDDDELQIQSLLVTVTFWEDKAVTVTRLSLCHVSATNIDLWDEKEYWKRVWKRVMYNKRFRASWTFLFGLFLFSHLTVVILVSTSYPGNTVWKSQKMYVEHLKFCCIN